MSDLVEVIFVQLADEACEVAVLKVFWEDSLGKPLILSRESDLSDVPISLLSIPPPALRSYPLRHPISQPGSMLDPQAFFKDSQHALYPNRRGLCECTGHVLVEFSHLHDKNQPFLLFRPKPLGKSLLLTKSLELFVPTVPTP